MSEKLVEAVKTSVISAFRAAIDTDYPDLVLRKVRDNIDLEYPVELTQYPAIWVNFSLTELRKAALEPYYRDEENKPYKLGSFKGRVTMNILALTSLDRDRISGDFINMYLFGRLSEQADDFHEFLQSYAHLNLQLNEDELTPGGQTTTLGTPWDATQLVYEDSYTFQVIGQFKSQFDATVNETILTRIDVVPRVDQTPLNDADVGELPPGTWH